MIQAQNIRAGHKVKGMGTVSSVQNAPEVGHVIATFTEGSPRMFRFTDALELEGTRFTLDGDPEYPALETAREGARWNGFAVPVATAAQLRNFVGEWAQIDRNGEWSGLRFAELETSTGATRLYVWRAGETFRDAETWESVETDETGAHLYALDGWTWTEVEDEQPARCPACGDVIDYCQGHGEIGDPAGRAILDAHDDGDHTGCHELADCQL